MTREETSQQLTTSVWERDVPNRLFTPLEEDTDADVCIVGAGIAGLTTAYFLARSGNKVVVVDDGPVGGGESGRTSAHLSSALDDRFYRLEQLHGEEGSRLAAESHSRAIDVIEEICNAEGISCEFERVDGYLFLAKEHEPDLLLRELAAAHRAGLRGVERLDSGLVPPLGSGPCLRFPNQGQFHPLRYLSGLAQAVIRYGGRIYTQTHIDDMQSGPPARVTAANGRTVTAASLVAATNTPVNDLVTIHTKQAAYRTYIVGVRIPKGSIPRALYWDTGDPYHYVRLQSNSPAADLLIAGGEDHKTGQSEIPNESHFDRLYDWVRAHFPMAGAKELEWSGQIMEPVDSLAFIGRNPGDTSNVYIATGDSGHGLTHGTIAGILINDLILDQPNPWAKLYDPSRVSLRSAGEFAKENLNVAAQYVDYVTGGEVDSPEKIPAGSGAIVRKGLKKLAVYRDEQGATHTCSAVCPHLGCVVSWNTAEKTWDCPCHGSRFAAFGQVVNGPALSGLSPAE